MSIQHVLADVKATLAKAGPDKLAVIAAQVDDVTETELCAWQQIQAQAHAGGKLQLETAQWLYQSIGGQCPTLTKWRALPLEDKLLVLRLIVLLAK